ncbi:monocarboxylate transporter 12-like [Amphiura filiformis]|uniref:monocarboxylate transporter 12-like n=1 Tax=Amphiura filiformis TaxID=82378 RepID=UPI003B225165
MEHSELKSVRGWIVIASSFLFTFFQLGSFKALGVFVPKFEEQLSIGIGAIGSIVSFCGALRFLLGPLQYRLANVVSARVLAMVSGILTGLGYICSAFSTSGITLTLSMTLLSLGLGVPMVAYVKIARHYFNVNFALYSAIAFTGGAVGMMILPPLSEFFIQTYGTQMALVLLGAVSFNLCVGGALLKPPDETLTSRPSSRENYEQLDSDCNDTSLATSGHIEAILHTILSWFGVSFMRKRPVLVAYYSAFLLWNISLAGWIIFLVPYTIGLGFPAQQASFMSTLGGVGTLVGRIIMFIFPDQSLNSHRLQFMVLSIGGAASLFLYPFVKAYWLLATLSFFAGLFLGTPPPVAMVMIKCIVPDEGEDFAKAIGLLHMSYGIGTLVGGPIVGSIFDLTGSFHIGFFIMAALEAFAAVLAIAKPKAET